MTAFSLTILALAKSMDFNVIAEGLETQAKRDFLEHQGCQDFQGHLFGTAMPIEQFEAQFFV
jgi:EAL domain-containing protein (putative c-di-GMP-specific phosphodiesterase class I)